MQINLDKIGRIEVMFEYLNKFVTDDEKPKNKEEVASRMQSIADRLSGYSQIKHSELQLMLDTAFWSGIWFGKTFPNKIKITNEKSNIKINESKIDYMG